MWQAVRNFRQSAWNDNAVAKQAVRPRIIPTAYMTTPPLVTWTDYQIQLMAQGVMPAPSPVIAADLLLGGNKRDAAAAVKTYVKNSVMGRLSFVPQVSINQDGQEERGATMRLSGVVGPTLYDDVAWAQSSFATFE